jgi:tRNA G18 (ribose-2'-O)-methylase SpoU
MKKMQSPRIEQITKLAATRNIEIKYMNKGGLGKLVIGKQHQNVVLRASKQKFTHIKKFKEIKFQKKEGNLILLLDQVHHLLGYRSTKSWLYH